MKQMVGLKETMGIECVSCGKIFPKRDIIEMEGNYCTTCFAKQGKKLLDPVIVTTTNNIDGYKVKRYIDIESIEIVLGTGVLSEFTAGIGDVFGLRSAAFEGKLSNAKKNAMQLLKYSALKKGGNAVIGIDIDYTEFSGNRIGLIINGTIVEIEPII
jgi:uncharacterized protein YbjQ (UPF0145 family)